MPSNVYIYKCAVYDKEYIKPILQNYFKNTVFKDKNILLKPNMLQAHEPSKNVTTNPAIVESAAEIILDSGGFCSIGDSPSGWGIENAKNAARETGMQEICTKLDIEFDFFDNQRLMPVKIENAKICNEIFLPESYFSYDIVINIPKLKTHGLTIFTLGVKNMMGLIPGLYKADFHRIAAHPKKFALLICDLYSVLKPDYTVLDSIEGMQGEGPVTGTSRKLDRIFISDDANALDAAVSGMCGIDPAKVPLISEVSDRGLGEIENINIIKEYEGGDPEFDDFRISRISVIGARIPVWFINILAPFLLRNPSVDTSSCSSCRECTEICPVNAIAFSDAFPVFDMSKCIKCFCCAERCTSNAIIEKRGFLGGLFSKKRSL